jgi:hypothetical protein
MENKSVLAAILSALTPAVSDKLSAPRPTKVGLDIVTRLGEEDKSGAARVEVSSTGKGFAFFAVPGCAPDKRPGVCKLSGPADTARALVLLAGGAERVKSPRTTKAGGKPVDASEIAAIVKAALAPAIPALEPSDDLATEDLSS